MQSCLFEIKTFRTSARVARCHPQIIGVGVPELLVVVLNYISETQLQARLL
jgi:hypothetical protein